jgi:signal transduction histidine kinase
VQVLTNLLSNAIKFSGRGTQVDLTASVDGPVAVMRVRDRGRGIPRAFHEAIFERFLQVDASDSRRNSGSGLGLAIARAIVHQHHGTIAVESREGEGSEFSVRVPLATTRPSALLDGPRRK